MARYNTPANKQRCANRPATNNSNMQPKPNTDTDTLFTEGFAHWQVGNNALAKHQKGKAHFAQAMDKWQRASQAASRPENKTLALSNALVAAKRINATKVIRTLKPLLGRDLDPTITLPAKGWVSETQPVLAPKTARVPSAPRRPPGATVTKATATAPPHDTGELELPTREAIRALSKTLLGIRNHLAKLGRQGKLMLAGNLAYEFKEALRELRSVHHRCNKTTLD